MKCLFLFSLSQVESDTAQSMKRLVELDSIKSKMLQSQNALQVNLHVPSPPLPLILPSLLLSPSLYSLFSFLFFLLSPPFFPLPPHLLLLPSHPGSWQLDNTISRCRGGVCLARYSEGRELCTAIYNNNCHHFVMPVSFSDCRKSSRNAAKFSKFFIIFTNEEFL